MAIPGVQSGQISIRDTYLYYVSFGHGEKPLAILPGLSTRSLKGSGTMLACMYRLFSREYKVYIFDRIHAVPEGYSVHDMAEDTVFAMRALGIGRADVFGVSQGGMIAQTIAAEHADMVRKLVLGVTLSRQNDTINAVINRWIGYAEQGDYLSLNRETFTLMYSDAYLEKNRRMLPIAERLVKPEDLKKFAILARACLTFDGDAQLDRIGCPTLVLGGRKDKVVTGEASEEIAERLRCACHIYEGLGHAAYTEAKDFNDRVYAFLRQ